MKFQILGPLQVEVDSEPVELPGIRQQVIVATLLLNANRVVAMDRLLEAVYGEDQPPTARAQVQISISSIRRLFHSRARNKVITTSAHGYIIRLGDGELDAQCFEETVTAARAARDLNNSAQAVAKYRDALRIWRGQALAGIDSQLVRAAAARLDELRVSTIEDRIALELDLGRHHELVGELAELVGEHPLRERLHGQLMLALYRCGRTAEALQAYRNVRRTMIDELGIDPSEQLQQLEYGVLTSDPALDLPTRTTVTSQAKAVAPNLLPADIADFTGRANEVDQIHRYLIQPPEQGRLAVPLVVIVGKGGVGKSALAVHAAHRMIEHFPDGQLFADLHGGDMRQASPARVLERFLRALGIQGSNVPEGIDERAEVYRNLLADRRILVLLDDVSSESQVLPLLPGNATAGVIIASRNALAGLAGALRITANVFDPSMSVNMIAHIVGCARVHAQPEAAAALARHCGHLPLALRIAGARLIAKPHWSVQQLVERLADESRRLDELRYGEMSIRPSISLTYESTDDQARRLFRRLALLDMADFSAWVGSALLDQPMTEVEDLLEELVSAQLIDVTGSGSVLQRRYRFHDLIRMFARERLAADEPAAERRAALERVLSALLYLAEEAHRSYYGGDFAWLRSEALRWPLPAAISEEPVRDPLSWYDRERATLVCGVRQAAQAGFIELCWSLASSAEPFFESRVYLDDWRETHEIALEATRRGHNLRGEAAMLYHMGSLHITQLELDQALQELTSAARLFEEAHDMQGVALATFHIAAVDRLCGRLDDAAGRYELALASFREMGDHIGAAYVMHGLAQVKLEEDKLGEATELLSEAWRLCQEARHARLEAQVLHRLGEVRLRTGDPAGAAEIFKQAMAITRDIGDVIGEAYALQGLGVAQTRQGEFDQAGNTLARALHLARTVGERMAQARTLLGLGELALARHDPEEAVSIGHQAAIVFHGLNAPLYEARALTLLGEAHAILGDMDAAQSATDEAAALRSKLVGDPLSNKARHELRENF